MIIRETVKKIISFCEKFKNTIVWIVFQIVYQDFRNYLPRAHNDKKLVILANGPSLKNFLANNNISAESDYCVVNFFANTPDFFKIKPQHYVLADPAFFDKRTETHTSHLQLKENFNKVGWKMTVYVPYGNHKYTRAIISNPNIIVIPFHFNSYNGWTNIKMFLFKKGLSMPRPQNVAIPAIYIGIHEGYKVIELFGVDHSWLPELRVNNKNEVCIIQRHFYDNEVLELKPWHRGVGQPVYKMHEILRDWAWMFEGYHHLQNYAEEEGCEIINCTPDTYIDAFSRQLNTSESPR